LDNVVISRRREEQLVTLREVAQLAGVSIKTVSRIVNGDSAVNTKTRERVQRHLNALNYVPNFAARQMRSGASSVYGLMTDVVATTPYSVDIVRGAQSALKERHQTLLIASTDGDHQREKELWRMFRAHGVAGVIYASMFHRPHDVGMPDFEGPIVLANCFDSNERNPSIIPDDEGGGYTQARYLLQLGHRRIGILTLIPDIEATRLRSKGMRRAFAEAGVVFDASLEQRGMRGAVYKEELVAFQVAREMLSSRKRPTAVICGNDQVAMQVYAAACSLGLAVPNDLSIMGFDDLRLISETLHPQLTTVALPYFEIGRLAVTFTNSMRKQDGKSGSRILVPCPLVERMSCRNIA
jgi:LacI family transcriptional regulator